MLEAVFRVAGAVALMWLTALLAAGISLVEKRDRVSIVMVAWATVSLLWGVWAVARG